MAQPSSAWPQEAPGKDQEKTKIGTRPGRSYKSQVLSRLKNASFYLCKAVNSVKFSPKSKKNNKITETIVLDEFGSP